MAMLLALNSMCTVFAVGVIGLLAQGKAKER